MLTTPPFSKNNENPLLMKDDVGIAKPSTYNLPKGEFIYGKALARDQEGAKEVSMTWKFHKESKDKEPNRDFTELNKMSLKDGKYKSDQVSNYRKEHDARLKLKKGQNTLPIELPEEEFRYGRKNRPSTPMKLVMGNSYGLEAENNILGSYQWRASSQESNVKVSQNIRPNKASNLFQEANSKKLASLTGHQEKEQFKLNKFKQVDSKINTNIKSQKSQNQANSQVSSVAQKL